MFFYYKSMNQKEIEIKKLVHILYQKKKKEEFAK